MHSVSKTSQIHIRYFLLRSISNSNCTLHLDLFALIVTLRVTTILRCLLCYFKYLKGILKFNLIE